MQNEMFSVEGKRIVITGGAGVLGGAMAKSLSQRGATVVVMDYNFQAAESLCQEIQAESGKAFAIECNVLDKPAVRDGFAKCIDMIGGVDVLINGAGGNNSKATCTPPDTFFDLDHEAIQRVFDLNCMGTIIPSQVFGQHLADRGDGVIINISSMCAFTPLTRVSAYSAAKAAVSNFTQWLSTYMCQNHSANIRVNGIAPGFFCTEQNRFLLFNEDGTHTDRGKQIVDHTPMARYGETDDLVGTLIFLVSDASKFVTGIVIPVDGGFSAYSGV